MNHLINSFVSFVTEGKEFRFKNKNFIYQVSSRVKIKKKRKRNIKITYNRHSNNII